MPDALRLLGIAPLALALLASGCEPDPDADDDTADDDTADDDDDVADDDTVVGEITLSHTPPAGATEGEDVPVAATAQDDGGDVTEVLVHFRNAGDAEFAQVGLASGGGADWSGAIAGAYVSSHGLEYWLQATGPSGTAVAPEGAPSSTYVLDTANVAPPTPEGFYAWYVWSDAAVEARWAPSVHLDVASYEVFRSDDETVDGGDDLVGSGDGSTLSLAIADDVDATLASAYSWWALKVTDDHGETSWSPARRTSNLHLYEGFIGNSSPNAMASDGKFNLPTGIDVDPAGRIYVADSSNHRVQVFDAAGQFAGKLGSQGTGQGQFQLPWDVAVDSGGNLWVAEYQNHRVQVVDGSGSFRLQLGTGVNTAAEGGFWFPVSVDTDDDGFAYVVDAHNARVQKFAPDGAFLEAWTSAGGTPFSAMGGVSFSAAHGGLLVTDQGLDRVFLLSTDGELLADMGSSGTGEGQFTEPHGACGTAPGFVVVTDGDSALTVAGSHRLTIFDPDGDFSWNFGEFGSAEGEFSIPSDCVSAPDGTLWVVNRIDYRVHRYGP